MKNLLITSAVLAMLATPSLALDLGNNFSLDNDVTVLYSFEAQDFAASDKINLNYQVRDNLKVYLDSTVNLRDINFNGADFGVELVPAAFNKITLNAEAQFDADLQYTDTVISAELKF